MTAEAAAPARNWIEAEAPLGGELRGSLASLARRSRPSWAIWLPVSIVLASLLTIYVLRRYRVYESTVVLRAVEGVRWEATTDLTIGELREDVQTLAFTNDNLIAVIHRHLAQFPDFEDDAAGSLGIFRDAMDVAFYENDFIEDRQPGDPPRSTLITVSYQAGDPDLAWDVVHELANLLVVSGEEGQRRLLKRRQDAVAGAVRLASAELDQLVRTAVDPRDRRVAAARERLLTAQTAQAAAGSAATASGQNQVLRFDIVDSGRKPPPVDPRREMIVSFAVLLLVCLLATSLVAGTFDPRVLDIVDLAALGAPLLGQVPALPAIRDYEGPAGGKDEPPPRRV